MDSESEKDRIQQFVTDGNFHAAINIALSALNEYRRNEDQPGVDEFLGVIHGVVQALVNEFGSQGQIDSSGVAACCICGRAENSSELLAGAKGTICRKCAEIAARHFAGKAE